MYETEEIKNKIKTGKWTRADVAASMEELKTVPDLSLYTAEIYYISYGVFAYNFREYVYPMIELCQEVKLLLEHSQEKALVYLALVRLYFCMGFPPKIVEYGLKYAGSGYTLRDPLKSVYNTIVAAFTDCGLYQEADIYLEKMMDISRLDPCGEDVDFWDSDILNEFVYYDSKVYVKLGMGDLAGAEQASRDAGRLLDEKEIPEDAREFFIIQKECTDMYFRMYQTQDNGTLAEEFNAYMKRLEAGEGMKDSLSFCVRYFGELLQVMEKEKRWEDIIRIGNFIKEGKSFSGSLCPVYKVMCKAAHMSQVEDIRKRAPEYEKMYLETLEQERENYEQMVKLLAKEELRIVRLKEAMEKDTLTGCLNRNAFDRGCKRFIRDHKDGVLVFIDLDHLKIINDNFGHENGDRYLLHFAKNINRSMEKGDLLSRYAGDEFLILSSGNQDKMEEKLKNILEKNPISFRVAVETRNISFSYGIVAFEEKEGKIAELVKEADHRMYLCKSRNHQRILEEGGK